MPKAAVVTGMELKDMSPEQLDELLANHSESSLPDVPQLTDHRGGLSEAGG